MIDKLIELLSQIWSYLIFFVIVSEYEEGVLLRFGKYKKYIKPGFRWKIPIVDNIIVNHTVWQTISLHPQSLTTKDNKGIVVKGIIKFRIADVKVFSLEVWGSADAISDMTMGIIRDEVMEHSWEEIKEGKLDKVIARKGKAEAKRWGIEIDTVTLIDMAEIVSIRLFNDTKSHILE